MLSFSNNNFCLISFSFSILPSYDQWLQSHFNVCCKSLDIEGDCHKAMETINFDVSLATNNHILGLLSGLSPITRCILVNAIYFRAKWAKPFDPGQTNEEAEFYLSNGQTAKCSLMYMVLVSDSMEFYLH